MVYVKYHKSHEHRSLQGLAIVRKRALKMFRASGESTHSSNGVLLPFVIEYLEENKIPYVLTAKPGVGYHIQTKEIK